jgi:hypothetical protein
MPCLWPRPSDPSGFVSVSSVVGPVGVVRSCARVILSGVRRRGSVLRKSLNAVFEVLCLFSPRVPVLPSSSSGPASELLFFFLSIVRFVDLFPLASLVPPVLKHACKSRDEHVRSQHLVQQPVIFVFFPFGTLKDYIHLVLRRGEPHVVSCVSFNILFHQ